MFGRKQERINELDAQLRSVNNYVDSLQVDLQKSNGDLLAANVEIDRLKNHIKKTKSLKSLMEETKLLLDEIERDVYQAITTKALEIVRNGATAKTAGQLETLRGQQAHLARLQDLYGNYVSLPNSLALSGLSPQVGGGLVPFYGSGPQ